MAITDIANAVPGLWNFGAGLHKDFVNRNGFLHACDFEARLNLDLIAAIDMTKIKAEGTIGPPAFAELTNKFETGAMLAMVAGSDRRNHRRLVKLLKKHWQGLETPLENEGDDASGKDADKNTVENALENFSFAVRKIEALKRISRIAAADGGSPFLKGLKLDVRLRNINRALCAIRNCLRDLIS